MMLRWKPSSLHTLPLTVPDASARVQNHEAHGKISRNNMQLMWNMLPHARRNQQRPSRDTQTPRAHRQLKPLPPARLHRRNGEKLHHSLFWVDPFGKDDHVTGTILGGGLGFAFWIIPRSDFSPRWLREMFWGLLFFSPLEAGEQIHCYNHHELMGLKRLNCYFIRKEFQFSHCCHITISINHHVLYQEGREKNP